MSGASILKAAVIAAVLTSASTALGQGAAPAPTVTDTRVDAKGVGISGGIIAGAEVVLAIESIAKVKPVWAWIVFPVLGAGGGGVGGYFLEKKSPEGAVALLVVSMAAIIPTAIGIAASRRYHPETEGAVEGDRDGGNDSYSFEESPSAGTPEEEATTTEVESRPSETTEEGPPAEEAAPPPETTEDDKPETEPAPTGSPTPSSARERKRQDRLAHLSAGALFHLSARRQFGLGIPAIDLRHSPNYVDGASTAHTGVEIHIPLLRLEIP